MEFELWWLLAFPLFFVLGWLAARIDIKHVVKESRALPRTYLTGLNFLLNEQPDKAIDAFIEAVKIDNQTVELHFALGSLFRRRGETDRAIRMHQNLIDREDLSDEQRQHALSELGLDFLKAGLLDRAEAVFVKLRGTRFNDFALNNLLDIYQQEKDWKKAIEIAEVLPHHEGVLWEKEVANFHCELAAVAMANSRFDEAMESLVQALELNRKSASFALARTSSIRSMLPERSPTRWFTCAKAMRRRSGRGASVTLCGLGREKVADKLVALRPQRLRGLSSALHNSRGTR